MTGLISCTMDCNLACQYCFEGNGDKGNPPNVKKINEKFENCIKEIDGFIDKIYEYNNQELTKIIFHGGEPTLIRPNNMKIVMEKQRNKGHNIKWEIQTNGTIITDENLGIFVEYNVGVGISLDGLKKHHDKYRVTKFGEPTFDLIIKNIKKLRENKVRCGVLVTITDNNVDDLIDIYNYLAKEKIGFSFNALYPTEHKNNPKLSEERFSEKLCELFDRWVEDEENKIIIGPFLQIIEGLISPERGIPSCNWQKNCGESFVTIDTEKALYPCEHWVGYSEMKICDYDENMSVDDLQSKFFANRIELLKKSDCKDCEIFKFCYGGCPWNAKMLNGNVMTKDSSICIGRRTLIKHIYYYLKDKIGDKISNINFE